jgi:ABC-type nitrate/sulfonate/bicarbonate transport system permease component
MTEVKTPETKPEALPTINLSASISWGTVLIAVAIGIGVGLAIAAAIGLRQQAIDALDAIDEGPADA